jgi:hypothetical protein
MKQPEHVTSKLNAVQISTNYFPYDFFSIPLTGRGDPLECEMSIIQYFLDNLVTDGGEVVNLTRCGWRIMSLESPMPSSGIEPAGFIIIFSTVLISTRYDGVYTLYIHSVPHTDFPCDFTAVTKTLWSLSCLPRRNYSMKKQNNQNDKITIRMNLEYFHCPFVDTRIMTHVSPTLLNAH